MSCAVMLCSVMLTHARIIRFEYVGVLIIASFSVTLLH